MKQSAEQHVDNVTTGPGGVMTETGTVGVVTGDLTVATTALPGGHAHIAIQYTGAEEWYTLKGSPLPVPAGGIAALHETVLDRVRAGGEAEAAG